MTIHRLEVFCAVARRLNITAVSRQLHVNQPAISLEIKRLEQSLGVTLFRKRARGIELTVAGAAMQGKVEEILSKIDALRTKYRTRIITLVAALGACLATIMQWQCMSEF